MVKWVKAPFLCLPILPKIFKYAFLPATSDYWRNNRWELVVWTIKNHLSGPSVYVPMLPHVPNHEFYPENVVIWKQY